MKAAILGIGTELTDGQIINRNGAWISQKLKALGLRSSVHLVVPDDRALILQALDFCAAHADVLFVTGGLGPTSDDFTRELIAEWAEQKLVFHEPSWQHVQDRLTSRGYVVKEIQKQQCFFPESSEVLVNPEGTANGFSLQARGKKFFVLPGPPREIEAIWNSSIGSWAAGVASSLDPHVTLLWETLGVGESDIAVIVEEILKGVDVDRGYRVHLPYVEVKLMFPQSQRESLLGVVAQLDQALAYCTFSKSDEDTAAVLARKLSGVGSLEVHDAVTGSYLISRLTPAFRNRLAAQTPWLISNDLCQSYGQSDVVLGVNPVGEHICEVVLVRKRQVLRDLITAPYKTANMRERRLQYFAERALIFWIQNLR